MAGNFYYVNSAVDTDGLGNSYATNQVGNSFATLSDTNVYGTIAQAIAAGASDDDDIIFAAEHAHSESSSNISYPGGTSSPLRISCATTADCGIPATGGSEVTTGAIDFDGGGGFKVINDLRIDSADNMVMGGDGRSFILNHCFLNSLNSSNSISVGSDGFCLELNDCIIDIYYNNTEIYISGAAKIVMNGGSFASSVSGSLTNLFLAGFITGGGYVRFNEVDLSLISGNIIGGVGADVVNDDMIDVHIDKCKTHASVTYHNETFVSANQRMLVTQSSHDSASAEYQYYFHTRGGTVQDATNIWRDESEPYYLSNQKVSLQAIGNSDTELAMPFIFDFPTRKAALSGAAATDVVRIYLAVVNTTTLYDDDVWAELVYPDGTNKNVFNKVNSLATPSNHPTDILRTPAVLPTDSASTWKDAGGDLTGYNEYYMDLDTSADAGEDCVPKIVMHVALTLATGIYFDTSVGVVSS